MLRTIRVGQTDRSLGHADAIPAASFGRIRGPRPIASDPVCAEVLLLDDHHSATEPSSWKTRAMGLVPPKGYLAKAFSFISNPRPGLSGSGKRPFTIRITGNPTHSSHTFSFIWGSTPLQIS